MVRRYFVSVCNIPWTISHLELETYFSKFGFIRNAKVLFDKHGLNTGYGFVEFHDQCAMNTVLRNTHILEEQKLYVVQGIAYLTKIDLTHYMQNYIFEVLKHDQNEEENLEVNSLQNSKKSTIENILKCKTDSEKKQI